MPPAYDPVLQQKLDQLWFRLSPSTPAAEQGLRQQWLLRIFQSYAKQPFGARDDTAGTSIDAERLRQVPLSGNARLPAGSLSHGIADAATRTAIDAWCADQARLRCPVVFQARAKQSAGAADWPNIVSQGFIFHDELQDAAPRVFVRDFTGRHPLVPGGKPALVPVGTAIRRGKAKTPVWGIVATARQSLGGAGELGPEAFIGEAWADLTPLQQANFRVVAAVGWVEADGVIDALNGWDNAVLSAGPYQFTAYHGGTTNAAELGALLAYWGSLGTSEYPELRDSLGIGAAQAWSLGLRNASKTFAADLGLIDQGGILRPPTALNERNYLRTWHVFYQVQAALRSMTTLRTAFWPYTRQRVADILATDWGANPPPGASCIGDVFRSELSVALLLRWHVYRPAHIIENGRAGIAPKAIVSKAKLANKPVASWTRADELALVQATLPPHTGALKPKSTKDLRTTLNKVVDWSRPEWGKPGASPRKGTLDLTRDFVVDLAGVPFPTS